MKHFSLISIDIAKKTFHVCGFDDNHQETYSKKLGRAEFTKFVNKIAPTKVYIEACGTSHYWARILNNLGHQVKLINPFYVKPFVIGNKNDANDAQAIAAAALSPGMKFVKIKSETEQAYQLLLNIRESLVGQRTALLHEIRSILAEFGVIVDSGKAKILKVLKQLSCEEEIECKDIKLKVAAIPKFLKEEFEHYLSLLKLKNSRILSIEKKIKNIIKEIKSKKNPEKEKYRELEKVGGIGPITIFAVAVQGDLSHFVNGRSFAAYIGLVPKEFSSGQRKFLGGITKKGNIFLRKTMIHGARAYIARVKNKEDLKATWVKKLVSRIGYNKAVVALANKHARIIHSLLTKDEEYDEAKAFV